MKFSISLIVCLLLFTCHNPNKTHQNTTSQYHIIPKPVSLKMQDGQFVIDSNTSISRGTDLENEGQYLADMLSHITGKSIDFNTDTTGNIQLKLDDAIENKEGYELSVTYDAIIISGKNATGVFYGIQTLRQLMPASIESESKQITTVSIPAVHIKDHPRFVYRGMHLDVARHFFPVEFIKKYIDLLALHKMNTFHWHLTEDQGWRIEIKKYPKLTEVGSKRYGTLIGHHPGTGNDETEYGGFYTQEEVKDIVKYATERHINVIPEIELPGHGSAAIAAYPHLSCFPDEPTIVFDNMGSKAGKEVQRSGTPKIVQETWGVFDDVFCAGNEETFQFLEDVFAEVIPLFPSEYIHIGGDECPKSNWERCSPCQKRMKDNGLVDEHELQSYFIHRIERFLNANGKKIIGWDEILEGGLAPNATVMSWRGEEGGIAAAKQNHDVIMTPGHSCYFDHYQTADNMSEPLAIGGKTTVADVYAYEPYPDELTGEARNYILGAQANVWTEYMKTSDQVEYMILPRMTALSEVVWAPIENRDWADFRVRLNSLKERYETMGLNYAKHVFKIKIDSLENVQ
ncbi:beta-N-acetylhexosaminidase [Gelidibacter mesophilus]|uniref:beta-N-acetylhexosaminidase n=1 Tax=Gelidibacter mesophilus TaxID=169050 RepID=UPI0004065ECB|nr:beta-N-acetylhexosaminidase [Gelidibacter mesophilus]